MSNIVTLTTDWNNSDYYVGAFKAAVLLRLPSVVFVDISHAVLLFSRQQAGFIVRNTYKNFPNGTIHVIGVDSEPDRNQDIVIAVYDRQYFICNNNGILGLVFDDLPQSVVSIKTGFAFEGATFPELSVFADIVSYILKNGEIAELGELTDDVKRFPSFLPQISANEINGEVIYIDSYYNAITNISKDFFYENVGTGKFEIYLNSNLSRTSKIYNSYKEVSSGEIVCVFNSLNLLEIAIREGKAGLLLNLDRKSIIRVKFNL
jgi:S-adenosylmethionine hydrolase